MNALVDKHEIAYRIGKWSIVTALGALMAWLALK
jgi:hypothetical protein